MFGKSSAKFVSSEETILKNETLLLLLKFNRGDMEIRPNEGICENFRCSGLLHYWSKLQNFANCLNF